MSKCQVYTLNKIFNWLVYILFNPIYLKLFIKIVLNKNIFKILVDLAKSYSSYILKNKVNIIKIIF